MAVETEGAQQGGSLPDRRLEERVHLPDRRRVYKISVSKYEDEVCHLELNWSTKWSLLQPSP